MFLPQKLEEQSYSCNAISIRKSIKWGISKSKRHQRIQSESHPFSYIDFLYPENLPTSLKKKINSQNQIYILWLQIFGRHICYRLMLDYSKQSHKIDNTHSYVVYTLRTLPLVGYKYKLNQYYLRFIFVGTVYFQS